MRRRGPPPLCSLRFLFFLQPDFRAAEAWGEVIRDVVKIDRRKVRAARRDAHDAALAQVCSGTTYVSSLHLYIYREREQFINICVLGFWFNRINFFHPLDKYE